MRAAAEKLPWNRAWAHSRPWTPIAVEGGEDVNPKDQVFQHGADIVHRVSRFRSLRSGQNLETGPQAQLARVEYRYRDDRSLHRGLGGDRADRAQLDRDVDGQDLRGTFGSQLRIHLAKYLRSRCRGGGGVFEFR